MTGIGSQVARGASWMVLLRLVDRGLGLISTVLLARLLVPADFGLVAMATAFIGVLEILGSFSFDLALIQKRNAGRTHYDTAWTFNILFGLAGGAIICLLAAPTAEFYRDPRVEAVLYALAPSLLLQGLENIGVVAFQKDLEFHKEFWMRLAKRMTGFLITLALAFLWRNYWALVVGMVASRASGVLFSYLWHPYRPRFSLAATSDLLGFSSWLLVNNILVFANNRGVDFVIGRVSGAHALGLFSVAYEVSNLPTTELVYPIQRAVFPGYALIANDVDKLKQAFFQVIGLIALVAVPAGVGLGIVAKPLIQVMLGDRWLEAVPLMHILAAFGIVRVLHGPTGSLYLALGKPRRIAVFQSVQIAVAIVGLMILIPRLGLVGAPWAVLIGAIFAATVNYGILRLEVGLELLPLLQRVWRPILTSAALIPFCHAISRWLAATTPHAPPLLELLVVASAGATFYAIALAMLWALSGRPAGPERQLLSIIGLNRNTQDRPAKP